MGFSLKKKLRATVRSPLDTVDSSGDIGTVRRSLPTLMTSQGIRMALYLGTNAALPFLMAPSEFGRIYQIQVPMTLCTLFGDFGIATGLVRIKRLTHELASLLFWLMVGIAAVSMLLVVGTVPIFESWYRTDGLWSLGVCFGFLLLVRAVGSMYRSLMRRQLRLKAIATFELVSGFFTNLSTLIFAAVGLGAISIPVGLAVGGIAELSGLALLSGWLPGRPAPLREAKPILRFGIGMSLGGLIVFGGNALSQALMGRYFDQSVLGLLERANALIDGFMVRFKSVVQGVLYPILARRFSDAGSVVDLASPLLGAAWRIWFPAAAIVAVMIGPALDSLYGGVYEGIGTLAAWIALSFLLFLPNRMLHESIVAHGRTRYLIRLNVFQSTMLLVATGVAIWQGSIVLFAALFAVAQLLTAVVNLVLAPWIIGWRDRGLGRDVLGGLLMAIPAVATFSALGALGAGLPVAIGLAVLVLGAMLTMYLSSRRGIEVRRLLAS